MYLNLLHFVTELSLFSSQLTLTNNVNTFGILLTGYIYNKDIGYLPWNEKDIWPANNSI